MISQHSVTGTAGKAVAFCVAHVVTELLLAVNDLGNTDFDEVVQCLCLAAVAATLFLTVNSSGVWKMLGMQCTMIFCYRGVDHWAHVGGATVGIVLAGAALLHTNRGVATTGPTWFFGARVRFWPRTIDVISGYLPVIGVLVVFSLYLQRLYVEDTYEEEILPDINVIGWFFRWLVGHEEDYGGDSAGVGIGGHPDTWVQIPMQR